MSKRGSTTSNSRMWPFNFFSKEGKAEKQETPSQGSEKKPETSSEKKNKEAPISNIAKAKQVISEIEAIIQKELSLMSEENLFSISENGNAAVPTKAKKRPAPKLIRPLNKKKNRIVFGDMEFDPIKNVWVGNEKDLNVFQRPTPGLITKISQPKAQERVGDMIFDPENMVWRGNEKELDKFNRTGGPELIRPDQFDRLEQNGMYFDPENMVWTGNEDDLDIFADIEKAEDERGFTVGKEFSLSQDVINSFIKCEQEHNSTLQGWCTGKESDPRKHLYAIRNMSLIRIITQAKVGAAGTVPSNTPRKVSMTSSEEDLGADFGPTNPTPKKAANDEDRDANSTPTSEKDKKQSAKPVTQISSHLLQFTDKDDEFDQDIDVAPVSKFAQEVKNLKPQAEDSKLFSSDEDLEEGEEDMEGIDLPSNSVLTLKQPVSVMQAPQLNNPLIHNLNIKKSTASHSPPTSPGGTLNVSESEDWGSFSPADPSNNLGTINEKHVVEEVWNDVDFPNEGLSKQTIQKPATPLPSSGEDLTDLILPQEGSLKLAPKPRSKSIDEQTEEEWNDIDIPETFPKDKLQKNAKK